MSQIEALIDELCPGGVEFIALAEVANVGTGSSNRNESTSRGSYPFYVRSKTVFLTDEFEFDEEAIIIPGEGGIGDIFHYVNGKYALHQRAYRIHVHDARLLTKFVLYYMQSNFKKFILTKAVSATVTSIRKPMILDFIVPLPPRNVQQEIVRILDTFTKLEAELEAELEARKKQYEHYRNALLSFPNDDVRWVPLSEACNLKIGEFVKKTKQDANAEFPVYNGGTTPTGYYSQSNSPGKSVVISARGSIGFVNFLDTEFWAGNSCYVIRPKNEALNVKFLYHYLKANEYLLYSLRAVGTIPALNLKPVQDVKVPLISLDKQNDISNRLDLFSELTSGLNSGLPAEIVARRKQNEYYRDRLLTFRELVA